ncbi:hypothetical protein B0H14DRAFT_2619565 [Mycena olivaceomarginata]|nr:hypothetical protein B0H14DRAFT_2619565 [Mycena olivaceomarginata]
MIDFRELIGDHSGDNMAEAVWETMYGRKPLRPNCSGSLELHRLTCAVGGLRTQSHLCFSCLYARRDSLLVNAERLKTSDPPRSAPEATLTTIHPRLTQDYRTVAARIQRQHPLPLDIKRIRIRSSIAGYRGGVTFIGVVLVAHPTATSGYKRRARAAGGGSEVRGRHARHTCTRVSLFRRRRQGAESAHGGASIERIPANISESGVSIPSTVAAPLRLSTCLTTCDELPIPIPRATALATFVPSSFRKLRTSRIAQIHHQQSHTPAPQRYAIHPRLAENHRTAASTCSNGGNNNIPQTEVVGRTHIERIRFDRALSGRISFTSDADWSSSPFLQASRSAVDGCVQHRAPTWQVTMDGRSGAAGLGKQPSASHRILANVSESGVSIPSPRPCLAICITSYGLLPAAASFLIPEGNTPRTARPWKEDLVGAGGADTGPHMSHASCVENGSGSGSQLGISKCTM